MTSKYGQKNISNKVFNSAKPIIGKNKKLYRADPYNNIIYKSSYGKTSEMSWEIDHIKPRSKKGGDSIRNLQALSTNINRSKGNTLVKKSRHSKCNK